MACMPLLPEKLCGAQEEAGDFFPAHYVGPLVNENGKVAVRMNPLGVDAADDSLGSRADSKALFEFFVAAVSYPSDLRGKAFDVLSF